MSDLPNEIMVWRSMEKLTHIGTWATERYPAEAVAFVSRADAEAAMAAVVERAADSLLECSVWCDSQERADANWHNGVVDARKHFMARIRDFAPIDGLALVRELRADADRLNRWRAEEGEKIKRQAKALTDLTKHCQRIEAENAGLARKIGKVQRGDGDHSQIADLEAKVINQRNELANLRARDGRLAELAVERDTLAAANAVLEAKVAGLVDAVKPFDAVGGTLFSKNWNMSDIVFDGGPMRSDCLFFEDFLNLRAALATQEAGTC